MAEQIKNAIIQIRNDTATNWSTVNPILKLGEMGIETDTHFSKTGDGTHNWNDLSYNTVPVSTIPSASSTQSGIVTTSNQTFAGAKTFTDNLTVSQINSVTVGNSPKFTDTTYSAGTGLSLSNTTFSHGDTSEQESTYNTGRTYIQSVTVDTFGHVTGLSSATETVTDTHYASGTVVGASNTAKTNEVTTNSTTFINHIENNEVKNSHQLTGSGATTVSSDANGNITINSTDTVYTHPDSGVTAGTYKSVTVNAQGHVTAGTNPTTLAGYGITDANINSGVITLGSNTITPAPINSPSLTGTPTAPTADVGTNTTQLATTAFVKAEINNVLSAADAMVFKGTIGTGGTVSTLPTSGYKAGWTYRVVTAGTYAGKVCEVGDLIICIKTYVSASSDNDWTVVQNNLDGAVIGPPSSVTNRVATFNGTTGKLIQDSGYTIATSVPSDAIFTDTKNTAGSTDTSSKIFLVGAATQEANPQTYSDNEVYVTNGVLTAKSFSGSLTGNSDTTTKLYTSRSIEGISFDGSADVYNYAECSTASSTSAKTASLTGFSLSAGAKVFVKFTNDNTASNPTLNINNTGDKAIKICNKSISPGMLRSNCLYELIYNGTNYDIILGNILKGLNTTCSLASNNWTGSSAPYVYTISLTGVTANSVINISNTSDITEQQLEALRNANIIGGTQTDNSFTLLAYGTKPTVDIPINVNISGEYFTEVALDNDTKVMQTVTTDNANYPILFKNTNAVTTVTDTTKFASAVTINPNTGNLAVTQINNATVGSSPKFTDTNYYPTTFSWTNGTSSGPTGSLTGSGMSSVSFSAIPTASNTQSGIITTSDQTFAGEKTFIGSIIVSNSNDYAECFDNIELDYKKSIYKIVELDENGNTILANENSDGVIGIVSNNYGNLLGGTKEEIENNKKIPVGLAGVLYVDSAEKVNIKHKNKFIVSAGNGLAKVVNDNPKLGTIVGKIIGIDEVNNRYKVLISLR